MENIILGLLMIKPLSGYEIQKFIKDNFNMICSESYGSIQKALYKLVEKESIKFQEIAKGKTIIKKYFITESGERIFKTWVASPMQAKKVKNMELAKLFFLGFSSNQEKINAIEDYILQIQDIKGQLLLIYKEFSRSVLNKRENELDYEIFKYNKLMIKYGLDAAEFEIQWYKKILEEISMEVK